MLVWEIDDQMSLVAESAGSVTSHSVTQEAVSKSQHLDSKAPIVSQGVHSLTHSHCTIDLRVYAVWRFVKETYKLTTKYF